MAGPYDLRKNGLGLRWGLDRVLLLFKAFINPKFSFVASFLILEVKCDHFFVVRFAELHLVGKSFARFHKNKLTLLFIRYVEMERSDIDARLFGFAFCRLFSFLPFGALLLKLQDACDAITPKLVQVDNLLSFLLFFSGINMSLAAGVSMKIWTCGSLQAFPFFEISTGNLLLLLVLYRLIGMTERTLCICTFGVVLAHCRALAFLRHF